jgi:dTDP-glucose 4,6-dehydratase
MKILVAGGAGFIGSHLCASLLKLNHQVFCLDNLITGREENIAELKENRQFIFIKEDICSLTFSQKIDYIFNLASPASPVDYQKYPIETLLVNSLGTKNLLQLALKNQAAFLLASTSEVYGDPAEHPQKEDYWGNVNPIGPRSCYDEAKRFAEALTMAYFRKHQTKIRIVRIFNTYGPKMKRNDGRVVSNFINQALIQKPLTVYGQGQQTRSFCYVSDMVDGLIKIMFSDQTVGQVINLGNPDERQIIEFAKLIKILTKSSSEIKYENLPEDDPARRCPDITRARKIVNWEPKIKLEDGLNQTISYFKSFYV